MIATPNAQVPAPARAVWQPAIEKVLRCPACGATPMAIEPSPRCARCGYAAKISEGIPDFVDEESLGEQHRAELAAQKNAVEKYYENEEKLSCQWDRITADELPPLLGFPSGLVLDLGCGTGTAGAAFRRAGAMVVGADLSIPCLKVAERRLDGVVRTDAARLPFQNGAFDAVVSRGALHHIHDPRAALTELARVTRPGARLLLADPREFAWLEPIKHALRKSDDSFSEEHHAYAVSEYVAMVREFFEVDRVLTLYPFGILLAVGLDLLPLPKLLPKRLFAESLVGIDRLLNETPLRKGGHLLAVIARKK